MATPNGPSKEFLNVLEFRGVGRRDFLRFCGSTAALLGLSELYAPQIASRWNRPRNAAGGVAEFCLRHRLY